MSPLDRLKFREDYRARLPSYISRFTGFRPAGAEPPYEPISILKWLDRVPLKYEIWFTAWVGAFGGILLIEAIMSTSTAFRDVYHSPTIITSFGASAVLLFGVIESPVAQPRNFVLGHFISALVGTAITRLWVLNASYQGWLVNDKFHAETFINGGLSMATSLLAMIMTGTAHPPAGATGLNAAVEAQVVMLSWRYLPVVIASSLIMLGWALIINNLGRRRYPLHWWSPEKVFVRQSPEDLKEKQMEEGMTEETREEEEEGDLVGETLEPNELRRESQLEEQATRTGEEGIEPDSLRAEV